MASEMDLTNIRRASPAQLLEFMDQHSLTHKWRNMRANAMSLLGAALLTTTIFHVWLIFLCWWHGHDDSRYYQWFIYVIGFIPILKLNGTNGRILAGWQIIATLYHNFIALFTYEFEIDWIQLMVLMAYNIVIGVIIYLLFTKIRSFKSVLLNG